MIESPDNDLTHPHGDNPEDDDGLIPLYEERDEDEEDEEEEDWEDEEEE